MNKTSIEWTELTWNPIHARLKTGGKTGNFCTKISPGCTNCYASAINKHWGNGLEYTIPNLDLVEFYLDEKELQAPLKRKKPARIFVGDMFDLFHGGISSELIEEVFLVMVRAKQHTFQILTKRAERMQALVSSVMYRPHSHIQFGVSVENQKLYHERMDHLMSTPAAVRFLSVEPQLEHVNLELEGYANPLDAMDGQYLPGWIHWVICGGESGPNARPFDISWARSLRDQCTKESVPFFFKQAGSSPVDSEYLAGTWAPEDKRSLKVAKQFGKDYVGFNLLLLKDRKGGNMSEWPEDLRVREFPVTA